MRKTIEKIIQASKNRVLKSAFGILLGASIVSTPGVNCLPSPPQPPEPTPTEPTPDPTPTNPTENLVGVNIVSWTSGDYPYTTPWKPETHDDSRGVTATDITTIMPFQGNGSLDMMLNIVDNSTTQRKGETFVDMRYPPAYEADSPLIINRDIDGRPLGLDLSDKTISLRVFCPLGTSGNRHAPNGIQLFFKSVEKAGDQEIWSDYYCNWQNIWFLFEDSGTDPRLGAVIEGTWSTITAQIPHITDDGILSHKPFYGHADDSFNPENVALIGIKYALNQNGWGNFSGTIHVDDLNVSGTLINNFLFTFEDTISPILSLRNNGFNCGAIVQTEYMDSYDSVIIQPHPEKSHSDLELVELIAEMKANGLRVMLKPHVDISDDTWRGYIEPTDLNAWFNAYTDFILHYAQIAENNGVEMLVIGTEFRTMVTDEYRAEWETLISQIRDVYSGKLTYAANWDDYWTVCFWDLVNVVGIDAYFPLSNQRDPSLNTLILGWSDYIADLSQWQQQVGKQIIFTETGYRSVDFAAAEPWEYLEQRPLNQELQDRCYKAIDQAFQDVDWFGGVLFWNWLPRKGIGGRFDTDFTPQNKIAQDVSYFHNN